MEPAAEVNPEAWVDLYGDHLFRYAHNRVNDIAVAEELVQETFLAAMEGKERFQGRSLEKTWLFSILKHKIIDHYRAQRKKILEAGMEEQAQKDENFFAANGGWHIKPQAWPATPEHALEFREFLDIFYQCLAKVPRRLADAFIYREMNGLSTEEICKILDVSSTNCGVMLYRARMLLRRCIDARWSSIPKLKGNRS